MLAPGMTGGDVGPRLAGAEPLQDGRFGVGEPGVTAGPRPVNPTSFADDVANNNPVLPLAY